jgi:hypothetical protein
MTVKGGGRTEVRHDSRACVSKDRTGTGNEQAWVDRPPDDAEVNKAVRKLSNGKSGGDAGCPVEYTKPPRVPLRPMLISGRLSEATGCLGVCPKEIHLTDRRREGR